MLRLRVAAAGLVVAAACGGNPPVELHTAAEVPAVVPVDFPRPDPAPTATSSTTTTTVPPTTTTTVRVEPPVVHVAPPPQVGDGCAGWADDIAAVFPAEQVTTACRVMMCETGGTGDPTIENPSSSASGLWQFLDSTWLSVTGLAPPASAYPASTQLAAAAALWHSSGWGAWSCG